MENNKRDPGASAPSEEGVPLTYSKFDAILHTRQNLSLTDFESECRYIESCVTFYYYTHSELEKIFVSKGYCKEKPVPRALGIASFLLLRNIHYLVASYKLFRVGLMEPALESTRVILESSLTNYSLNHGSSLSYFNEVFPFLKEVRSHKTFPDEPKISELVSHWKKLSKNGTTISRLAEELYEEKKSQIKFIEADLSVSSHAHITGSTANTHFSPEIREYTINTLIGVTVLYTISLWEVFFEFISLDPLLSKKFKETISEGSALTPVRIPLPTKEPILSKLKLTYDSILEMR